MDSLNQLAPFPTSIIGAASQAENAYNCTSLGNLSWCYMLYTIHYLERRYIVYFMIFRFGLFVVVLNMYGRVFLSHSLPYSDVTIYIFAILYLSSMLYVYRFIWPLRLGWLLVCCLYKEVYLQIFKCMSFW